MCCWGVHDEERSEFQFSPDVRGDTGGVIPQKYYQKFWVFVFAVAEQSGHDTIPVSIETEVDDLVVQSSLQECQLGHVKPWWRYFVQLGERWLLIESDY